VGAPVRPNMPKYTAVGVFGKKLTKEFANSLRVNLFKFYLQLCAVIIKTMIIMITIIIFIISKTIPDSYFCQASFDYCTCTVLIIYCCTNVQLQFKGGVE